MSDRVKTLPFVVAQTNAREALWTFQSIPGDAKEKCDFWHVPTQRVYLKTGDYSIVGMTDEFAIERKSAADLFQTLTGNKQTDRRGRFERELDRLNLMDRAFVVVEADWPSMYNDPPTRALPKTIYRSYIAYMVRYPGVHWVFCKDRRVAEITAFRIMKRYWEDVLG